jgi:hypothetical protein
VSDLQAFAGPLRSWRIGRYRIGRYCAWAWEVSDGSYAAHRKTPIGALIGQIRFKREVAKNPHKFIIGPLVDGERCDECDELLLDALASAQEKQE